jgi:hypothetical protein
MALATLMVATGSGPFAPEGADELEDRALSDVTDAERAVDGGPLRSQEGNLIGEDPPDPPRLKSDQRAEFLQSLAVLALQHEWPGRTGATLHPTRRYG